MRHVIEQFYKFDINEKNSFKKRTTTMRIVTKNDYLITEYGSRMDDQHLMMERKILSGDQQ